MTSASGPRLVLLGDRSPRVAAHARLDALIPSLPFTVDWVPSPEADRADLAAADGIWVVPGSPYVCQDGVLRAIRLARETKIPYLGTCGGFQHALLEYVRNVLGVTDAEDVQYNPSARTAVIVPLACSLEGQTAPLHLRPGSRLAAAYGEVSGASEIYHCHYGLNPNFTDAIRSGGLTISGWDGQNSPRVVELDDHPFFLATLFQPELNPSTDGPHPLIRALAGAVLEHADRR